MGKTEKSQTSPLLSDLISTVMCAVIYTDAKSWIAAQEWVGCSPQKSGERVGITDGQLWEGAGEAKIKAKTRGWPKGKSLGEIFSLKHLSVLLFDSGLQDDTVYS